jgi:hypothetical protein
MRTFQYQFYVALTLAAVLLHGQSLACEPPVGFVNPSRPDIAPLDELLARTEEMVIARSLADLAKVPSRPLSEGIRPTKDLPGVSGTFNLTTKGYGTPGARRLVCLTDGNMSVEEVLHTETNGDSQRFRYVVWSYTSPKFRDVSYAVGEFIRTQPEPGKTHVNWTYRFALKEGRDPALFRKSFLDSIFAEWMRSVMENGRAHAESAPAAR